MVVSNVIEVHPAWCSPKSCTAYSTELTDMLYHRSEPVVLPSDDPRITVFVFRSADGDGGNEYIELVELEDPVTVPWYLNEPREKHGAELAMTMEMARCLWSAIGVLAVRPALPVTAEAA